MRLTHTSYEYYIFSAIGMALTEFKSITDRIPTKAVFGSYTDHGSHA